MGQDRARRRRWPYVVAGLLVALLAAAGITLWVAYQNLDSNITTVDPTDDLGDIRPAKENQSLNVLAIGSDTREGGNDIVGGESEGLADTTMVLHLSADNSWAAGVSIPRDSMVQMPDCVSSDGTVVPGALRQFNAAYPIGGPACVQRTVEALTGLRIDHFVVIDFSGFVDMVDAVGGVTVYIPEPISDPQSRIYFDVGCQTLDGKQALDYVRVRKGVGGGDGSDLGRIERQQAFLTSLIQKVTSSDVLFNPLELYSFLDAVTSSVTTDPGIGSIRSMASVAVRVREIGLNSIEFTTVPNEAYPPDPNRVQWKQPEADELWRKLRLDEPLTPKPTAAPSASGSPTPAGSQTPGPEEGTASPSPTLTTTTADQPVCPAT
ncbi:MAG: LCP family protein [Actinomycetota bacterium]|nr:LCP family protein [Actinomycetota bacterium]MDH4016497.1 LCP family protein [Actinomycetota bacterium]